MNIYYICKTVKSDDDAKVQWLSVLRNAKVQWSGKNLMVLKKYLLCPSTFNTLLADELLYIEKGI